MGGAGARMRQMFAIWMNSGRVDYGIARPRLTFAGRFGIVVIATAVGGMGVCNVYSQMVANVESDSLPNTVPALVFEGDHAITGYSNTKPPPQTIGGAEYDPSAVVNPQPVVGFLPNSSITKHAQAVAEATPIDRVPTKLDERPQIAKKRPASAAQVYQLTDGRQVTVRRPTS